MIEKTILLVRGASGSGKSTFAQLIKNICILGGVRCVICEADDYFIENGEYKFDPSKLHEAHIRCQEKVDNSCYFKIPMIIISNTSTTNKEIKPYMELANKNGYKFTSVVIENRHGGKDSHNVPETTIKNQIERIKNSLKLGEVQDGI